MSSNVEEEAATWAVRHPLTVQQTTELEAWLAENPLRQGALLRAMAGPSLIEHAMQNGADRSGT